MLMSLFHAPVRECGVHLGRLDIALVLSRAVPVKAHATAVAKQSRRMKHLLAKLRPLE
jgi:hypothetical protein